LLVTPVGTLAELAMYDTISPSDIRVVPSSLKAGAIKKRKANPEL
jgi:hypothetical protein